MEKQKKDKETVFGGAGARWMEEVKQTGKKNGILEFIVRIPNLLPECEKVNRKNLNETVTNKTKKNILW